MQIIAAETDLIRLPLGQGRGGSGSTEVDVVFVHIRTDEETEGTGFTYSLSRGGESVAALLRHDLLPRVKGRDLSGWERIWDEWFQWTRRLGPGIPLLALSAVDIAVWDARARTANMPLHRLLGATRDQIEVYGSGRSTHFMSTEEMVAGSVSYVEEGYRAIKLRVGAKPPEEDVARVGAVRAAVGDHIRLMVDCNERLDLATALWLGARLEDLGVFWMEEPLPSHYVQGYRRLAGQLSLSIAVGEHLHGRYAFRDFIDAEAAGMLMPDAPIVGGITEWMRIAQLAETFGIPVTPHFLPELHIHVGLAAPNCREIEHFPLIDALLLETLAAEDGKMRAPNRAGHGMRFDPEALARWRVAL